MGGASEAAWAALAEEAGQAGKRRIADLLADEQRAGDFSVEADGLLFDYSKTTITQATRAALLGLAESSGLTQARAAMFAGEKINVTEGRAVLHTALRDPGPGPVLVDGEDVLPGVHATLARMEDFARGVRSGKICAPGGQAFTDVVNIGIGGSDLGPAMATRALSPYHDGPRLHFVSNVDGAHIADTLAGLAPETTLVIIASKTFTTSETMANARVAHDWLSGGRDADPGAHLVALSSASGRTASWGIVPERVFGFEDWVGGRYSLWGPIGLGLMLAVGPERFREMLAGGRAMDLHFLHAEPVANMPVMLALVGIWHRQGLGYPTRAVLPYEERLARLPAYLQQLEMESNGKRVRRDGAPLAHVCGPVVWGEPGTNGQHAFYQLIHQGTDIVPCEFMLGRAGHEPALAGQHRLLVANCLAQSKALMRGRNLEEARAIARTAGYAGEELERQAAQRVFPGNRPSTTLIYPSLTPFSLGQTIALYEHRVFVEGVILGINSFDQWGVELGKELAAQLVPVLEGAAPGEDMDASTRMLMDRILTPEPPVSG